MKRILVIEPNYLGDILMTTPVLRILRKYVLEQTEINVLTNNTGKEILKNNPYIDNFILKENNTLKERLFLLKSVRAIEPDYVFLFRTTFFNAFLAYFSNAIKTSGLNMEASKFFLTNTMDDNIKKNYRQQSLEIVNLIYPFTNILYDELSKIDIFLTEDEEKFEEDFLKQKIGKDEKFAIIHPGTTRFAKQWIPSRYSVAIDTLSSKGYKIIISGIKKEQQIIEEICSFCKTRPIVLNEGVSIRQLSCLIKQCSLFISPDTGPMYIASAFGKKLITLFGSTDPSKYGPFDIQKHKIIFKKLQCSPCYKNFCPLVKKGNHSKCMDSISSDEVNQIIHNEL